MSSTFCYGGHVRANGIRQHYLRYGEGPPLVVVPGITSPAATWGFVGERLGRRLCTYVMDVRGRGLSSSGPALAYDLDTYAADVAAFARALGLDRYFLLGHSMGGRIAARAAHTHGTAIARLILADPPLSGPGRRPYVKPLDFYLEAIRDAQAGAIDIEAVQRTYPHWTQEQLRTRAQWLHTCDLDAIAATHRGFQEEDIHGDLAALAMPTLLMVAGRGDVIRPSELDEVRSLQPALRVGHFPDASHMIPFDDLEGFARMAEDFLAMG